MDIRKAFETEKDRVKDGVWFDLGGAKFLVAYGGNLNPKWVKVAERVYKPVRYAIDHELLTDDQAEDLNLTIFVEACLLDWQGVEDNGEAVPFSKDAAKKILKDLPLLWQALSEQSKKASNYRKGDVETDSKN